MTSKISLNGVYVTSSMIVFGIQSSILDHLKGAIKLIKISRSSNDAKGKDKLRGNKYSIYHLFLLSISIRVMLLNVIGVKGTMALFVFFRFILVLF